MATPIKFAINKGLQLIDLHIEVKYIVKVYV